MTRLMDKEDAEQAEVDAYIASEAEMAEFAKLYSDMEL